MSQFIDFLNFKFIPMDTVFGIKKEANFLGYSTNFIYSLKFSIVFLLVVLVLQFVLNILYKAIFSKIYHAKRAYKFLTKAAKFNFFIRYILQTFLCFTLAAFFNVESMSFATTGDILGSIFSIFIIPLYISILFILNWFLISNKKRLHRTKFN